MICGNCAAFNISNNACPFPWSFSPIYISYKVKLPLPSTSNAIKSSFISFMSSGDA
jgi:hypothetical protein